MIDWGLLVQVCTALAAILASVAWPLVALTALILFRDDVRLLGGRIVKGRVSGLEIELAQLTSEVDNVVAELEEEDATSSEVRLLTHDKERESAPADLHDEARSYNRQAVAWRLAETSPRAAAVWVAYAFERELLGVVQRHGKGPRAPRQFRKAASELAELAGDPDLFATFMEFYSMRSEIVHGDVPDRTMIRFIGSAIKMLRLLEKLEVQLLVEAGEREGANESTKNLEKADD